MSNDSICIVGGPKFLRLTEQRFLSRGHSDYGDFVQVSHPASRALFFGGDHFESTVGGDRLAVEGIGDEDLTGVDRWVDFGD